MTEFTLRTVVAAAFTMALAAAAAAPASAQGQSMCADRAQVVGMLASRYGESVRGMGLANQNRVIEIFASDETGTWTITITMPNGTTCLMAAGRHFETVAALPQGEPL
ncbi:MAG: hypothetical protein ACOCYW_01695 [Roseicyclus sp.]